MGMRLLQQWRAILLVVGWAVLTLAATGCAETIATVRPAQSAQSSQALPALGEYQNLKLLVTTAQNVSIYSIELRRITSRVIEAIWTVEPDRFATIITKASDVSPSNTLHVTVQLTRYDKGSAKARALHAGLGQIHIEATVLIKDQKSGEMLGEYEVSKTFAWGGVYGASTFVDDVEAGFAKGVASLLLSRKS